MISRKTNMSVPTKSAQVKCEEHDDSRSPTFEPISVRIATAVELTGISRTRLYELIQSGDLDKVKIGRSTFIPFRSLRRLIEG